MERWTFLTNYGHVLLCIAADPDTRMKEVAERVGITERAAQRIVADLIAEGYLGAQRVGRRNRYVVNGERPFRHPVERDHAVGELVDLVAKPVAKAVQSAKRPAKPRGNRQ